MLNKKKTSPHLERGRCSLCLDNIVIPAPSIQMFYSYKQDLTVMTKLKCWILWIVHRMFSPKQPTGPIWSRSCNVHIYILRCPLKFFLAWGLNCRKSVIKSEHKVVFWIGPRKSVIKSQHEVVFWIRWGGRGGNLFCR